MKKILLPLMTIILLLSFAIPALAAQPIKVVVNGKAVSGVNVKNYKGTIYLPFRETSKVFGISSTYHKESNSVVVGTGMDQAKKLKRGSSVRLIVNGKVITGVTVPTISNGIHIPILKVAQELGVKASWNDKSKTVNVTTSSSTASKNVPEIESLRSVMNSYSSDLTLSANSVSTLAKYQKEFFAKDRSPLSLKKIAKAVSEKDIAKNVSSYNSTIIRLAFVELDSVEQVKLGNGQIVTGAIGHLGGTYNEMTESWEDSTYFVIFYLGTTDLKKGDKAIVHGIPVGKTQIELTNALGATWKEPLYAVAAGNFLSVAKEYDIESAQSQGSSVEIPELNAEVQKKLDRLQVKLSSDGLNIYDPYLNGFEIKSVQIGEYEYKPATQTTIPDMSYDGLTISLDSFKDSSGNAFSDTSGSFFVKITTNIGETVKMVDFQ